MNLGRAVDIIKKRCGFRQSGDADIISEIQNSQEHLETTYPIEPLPWFLLSERTVTSSVLDEERIPLPDNFITEYEEGGLWLQTPEGGEILVRKYDSDDLRAWVSTDTTDNITTTNRTNYNFAYAMTGGYFRLFPAPTESLEFKLLYYKKQSVLALTTDENNWLKHAPWVLIGMAGSEYAFSVRDAAAKNYFDQKKAAALQALTDFTNSRQLANRRMAMGETL